MTPRDESNHKYGDVAAFLEDLKCAFSSKGVDQRTTLR